jgi:Protein of unknown function (DUF3828)
MYRLTHPIIIALLIISLALQACVPIEPATPAEPQAPASIVKQSPTPVQIISPEPVEPTPCDPQANGPDEIAQQFFEAYMTAVRNNEPNIGSPEFEAQKYLSPAYLEQLAEIRAGFDGFGFDPVLQAQDVPPDPLEVKEASVERTQATVILQFGRGLMERPYERIVSLEQIEGQWLIVPDRLEDSAATAEDAVEAFYTWYLGYISAEAEPRNPLVDQAYRAAPYLDPILVAKIDRMGEETEGLHIDPFLCAQDVPTEVSAVASYDNGSRPVVLVETSFPGHYITLDLVRANFNQWAIRSITCGNTPAAVAKAFYTWTLSYITKGGEMHNPWLDGAHRQSPFVSQAFIQKLDELLASAEPLPADPVILAQDLPTTFTTAGCPEPDCALVNMQFGDSLIRQLHLEMVTEDGSLRIASIQPSNSLQPIELEGWLPLVDDQYGYAIRYPAGWVAKGLNVADQHTPEESPHMRMLYFIPETGAEFAPITLDVVIWPKADLSEIYLLSEKLEETQVNGYTAQVYRSDPGIIYYIFQHPNRPDLWIVLGDSITHFPGREELAKSFEGVFGTFVSTITFP